jgi:hypothetical protein
VTVTTVAPGRNIITPYLETADGISEHNRRALEFLEQFMQTPDDSPPGWWDEFRQWMRDNPVRFGGGEPCE